MRIRPGILPRLYNTHSPKRPLIICSSRKTTSDSTQVVQLLRLRGCLKDFELAIVNNQSAESMAARLREATVFLHFAGQEGFGLPAAEAMACGCVVIGYHGFGGREFMRPEFCFPIEFGDVISFAKTAEAVLNQLRKKPLAYDDLTRRASEFMHATYAPENERADVVRVWGEILELVKRRGKSR